MLTGKSLRITFERPIEADFYWLYQACAAPWYIMCTQFGNLVNQDALDVLSGLRSVNIQNEVHGTITDWCSHVSHPKLHHILTIPSPYQAFS